MTGLSSDPIRDPGLTREQAERLIDWTEGDGATAPCGDGLCAVCEAREKLRAALQDDSPATLSSSEKSNSSETRFSLEEIEERLLGEVAVDEGRIGAGYAGKFNGATPTQPSLSDVREWLKREKAKLKKKELGRFETLGASRVLDELLAFIEKGEKDG